MLGGEAVECGQRGEAEGVVGQGEEEAGRSLPTNAEVQGLDKKNQRASNPSS